MNVIINYFTHFHCDFSSKLSLYFKSHLPRILLNIHIYILWLNYSHSRRKMRNIFLTISIKTQDLPFFIFLTTLLLHWIVATLFNYTTIRLDSRYIGSILWRIEFDKFLLGIWSCESNQFFIFYFAIVLWSTGLRNFSHNACDPNKFILFSFWQSEKNYFACDSDYFF